MNTIKIFKKFPSLGWVRGNLIILFIVHCSLLIAQPSWPPQGILGDGSQGNPWQITDSSHLRILADYVNASINNSNATVSKYYKLMNNIDLIGYANWAPIGGVYILSDNSYSYFGGNFDGNGKVVQNLTINRSSEDYIGLFGSAIDATIENVGIINCNIAGKNNVGGIVGMIYFASVSSPPPLPYRISITNCFVIGNVSSTSHFVGGLIGSGGTMSVTNCYFMGNVSGNNNNVGGLIGQVKYANVFNCFVTGNVRGTSICVGGLIGSIGGGASGGEGGGNSCIISNCYATNSVSGVNYVGGLAGWLGYDYSVTIRNCVAANSSVIGTNFVNRIVGEIYHGYGQVGGTLQNNYALNTMVVRDGNGNVPIISNLNTEYGMSIPIDSLKSFTFYNTYNNWYGGAWNINPPSGVWKICDKRDLPFLRWQGIDCYYDIIASAGDNGNINPSGTVNIVENTNQTFIFTPNTCYEVDSLWIDGVYSPDSIIAGSYTFNNVTKNHTIEVSFRRIEYNITHIIDTTCSNEPYLFGNQTLISSGIYYNTLQNINGCDSVIELTLTVNPATFMSDSVAICEGDFYDFHGKLLHVADIYYDTLQTIHGCDSIFELILTVNPSPEIPTITKTDNILTSSISDSYQWYCNGVSILSATFQNYIYTENGKYLVAVTNEFGCTAISTEMDVNDVGIVSATLNNQIRVYPNPAGNQLIIEIAGQARNDGNVIDIFDVVGQMVYTSPNPSKTSAPLSFQGGELAPSLSERAGGEVVIDISHLASGMYFLKIGNRTARFVKE